jgi:hypothetical protein
MPISLDPASHPHTVPNTDSPKPGDLVYGRDGLFAVCHVGPGECFGLLSSESYSGVIGVELDVYTEAFATRILVKESVADIDPGQRVQ